MFSSFSSRLTLAALLVASLAPAALAEPITPKIFQDKGCVQCHKITAYGIDGGETGPDLSIAYADVKDRFGVPLEKFLMAPTGTMQVVLSSMIKLDTNERKGIIKLLKEANEKTAHKK